MTILITGCAGFIGSHLCEKLLKKGSNIAGIDNLNPYYDPELKRQNLKDVTESAQAGGAAFNFFEGDIRQAKDVARVFENHKIDTVIHLAAMAGVRPSIEDPVYYYEVNEVGTAVLLEAARKASAKNFVFASSSSVYGNNKKTPFAETDPVDHPISPYAATKKAGELLCHIYHKIYQMNVACLRFFTVYGPRQRPDLAINKFTHLILKGLPIPVYGDGSKSRDFTFIDDIIDGIEKAHAWAVLPGEARYEIFNLGESEPVTVNDLIQQIEKTVGKKAIRKNQPDVPGDVEITYADVKKAREVLGYAPQVSIEEGIKRYVKWVEGQMMRAKR